MKWKFEDMSGNIDREKNDTEKIKNPDLKGINLSEYVNAANSEVKNEQEHELDDLSNEGGEKKESSFLKKAADLFSNTEIRKQFAKSMLGSITSIAGIKSFYDVPKYLSERWQVRGIFGQGKGLTGSMDELLESSWNNQERVAAGEEKSTKVREAIRDLNYRLSLTREGGEKGSDQRKKMAEILRENRHIKTDIENSAFPANNEEEKKADLEVGAHDESKLVEDAVVLKVTSEYEQKREARLEAAREKMANILDNYTTTKTTGMQAAREALNTTCVASGALAIRPLGYGLMDAMERFQKLNKESKNKTAAGEVADPPKFWRDVIAGSIKETYQEALLKDADGIEKSKLKKGVDFAKAWGKIARYVGMGAMATFQPEKMTSSIESALGILESKQALSDAGQNFQNNFDRSMHVSLFADPAKEKSSFELVHGQNQQEVTPADNKIAVENKSAGNLKNITAPIKDHKSMFDDEDLHGFKISEYGQLDNKGKAVVDLEGEDINGLKPGQYGSHLLKFQDGEKVSSYPVNKSDHFSGDNQSDLREDLAKNQPLVSASGIKAGSESYLEIEDENGNIIKNLNDETVEKESSVKVGNGESFVAWDKFEKPIETEGKGVKVEDKIIDTKESVVIAEKVPIKAEQSTDHLNELTRLKSGGSVKFDYDESGNVIGKRIILADYIPSGKKIEEFRLRDSGKIISNSKLVGFASDLHGQNEIIAKRTVEIINNQMNRYLLMYAELNSGGHKKEAKEVLDEMYDVMEKAEKNIGAKVFDRTKFPKF